MLKDRYDNLLSTTSVKARDLYVDAVDRLLSAAPGTEEMFVAATDADPGFALAHCGLARTRQILGNGAGAREAIAAARPLASENNAHNALTAREVAHVHAMDLLAHGKVPDAYPAIRQHLSEYPRDAVLAQTCTSVFGLIGFSGLPGREAETLAFTAQLLPHYGNDWWFLCQHAFSLVETGQTAPAETMIEQSLALKPDNAHAAHIRAHVYYEAGDSTTGARYLNEWMRGYSKAGTLHCHLSWHVALWALEQGDTDQMWQVLDASVMPDGAWGPPLNVLTDSASILYRAQLAGVAVPPTYWQTVSKYAAKFFPKTGIAFADVHAALAHAIAGESDALQQVVSNARGPAADVVRELAEAFGAIAGQKWSQAIALLTGAMSDHARIGGSRAQRDLLEYALLGSLLKQGESEQARRLLALRRPVQQAGCPVQGIA